MRTAETVTFARSGLDRSAELRAAPEALARLRATGQAATILFWRGKPMVRGEGPELVYLPPGHPALPGGEEVFLGLDPDGRAVFLADLADWTPAEGAPETLGAFLDPSEQRHPELPPDHRFAELRAVMTRLSPAEAGIAATARALLQWHQTHGFCARCGAASGVAMAGWQRDCPACGAHHFPRTDPVVIMLVTHGNSVLLGRSPGWPAGMYSCLAGFMEPGESLEAAVRRETFEEAGVRCGAVRYLASQPWPFPASLMLGCQAEALDTAIRIDPAEIEDAQWVSRERLAGIMAGEDAQILPARSGAIAHFLLLNWLADRLD